MSRDNPGRGGLEQVEEIFEVRAGREVSARRFRGGNVHRDDGRVSKRLTICDRGVGVREVPVGDESDVDPGLMEICSSDFSGARLGVPDVQERDASEDEDKTQVGDRRCTASVVEVIDQEVDAIESHPNRLAHRRLDGMDACLDGGKVVKVRSQPLDGSRGRDQFGLCVGIEMTAHGLGMEAVVVVMCGKHEVDRVKGSTGPLAESSLLFRGCDVTAQAVIQAVDDYDLSAYRFLC